MVTDPTYDFLLNMVETRATKSARELRGAQEESSLLAISKSVKRPPGIPMGVVIHCIEPMDADCKGFYAKTYPGDQPNQVVSQ